MFQKLGYRLVILSLILLPFNGLPFHLLGEGSKEGAIYPLIILSLVFVLHNIITPCKHIKKISFYLLIFIFIFFIFIFIVYYFNYVTISNVHYMNRTGNLRFIQQIVQLLLGFLIVFSVSLYLNSKKKLLLMVKYQRLIIIFFISFSFFQFIAYTFNGPILEIYRMIGEYIYREGVLEFALERRHALHSVSQEPSFLSMYLSFSAPFVIAFSLYKKYSILPIFIILVVIMSFSRTGYVIFGFQFFILLFFFNYKYFTLKKFLIYLFLVLPILIIVSMTPILDVFLSLFDIENNGSNAARYAGIYSALSVWLNNNLFLGIGLGQTGFHSIEYLPSWGFLSGDVHDTVEGLRWPPIHNLLVRVLVETGLIGFFLWISLFIFFIQKVHSIVYIKYKYFGYEDWLGYAIFTSLLGVFLSMLNRELFTNMIIWSILGISLSYIKINTKIKGI